MNEKIPQWAQQRIDEAREKGLTKLDLNGWLENEKLTAVPDAIAQLSNLRQLYLSRNRLTAVPAAIAQLSSLQKLRLDGNQLTAIPDAIAQLSHLQWLDLSDNRLTAIPNAIAQLPNLQRLDLSGNRLTAVPAWLVELPKLEGLYLYDNPIATPPPETLKLEQYKPVDLEALRAFFRQQAQQAARLYEAKLLIVGEPGAGKTSLTRKLLDPAAPLPGKDESTEGIDVWAWTFPLPVNREPLSVNREPLSVNRCP